MKILLIGGTGTIGKAVANELNDHEIIIVGSSSGDHQVDLTDDASITGLFEKVGKVDAVISTYGPIAMGPVTQLTKDQYQFALDTKVVGNLNMFKIAQEYINEGGSFTVTSGILSQQPMPGGAAIGMANAALDAFAAGAALDLGDKLRVNTVMPHFVKETMDMIGMDSSSGISAADTAKAFRQAVEGNDTGKALDVAAYI